MKSPTFELPHDWSVCNTYTCVGVYVVRQPKESNFLLTTNKFAVNQIFLWLTFDKIKQNGPEKNGKEMNKYSREECMER